MRSTQLSHWGTCQGVGDMPLLHVDSPSIQQLLRLLHRLLQSHNSARTSAEVMCRYRLAVAVLTLDSMQSYLPNDNLGSSTQMHTLQIRQGFATMRCQECSNC